MQKQANKQISNLAFKQATKQDIWYGAQLPQPGIPNKNYK